MIVKKTARYRTFAYGLVTAGVVCILAFGSSGLSTVGSGAVASGLVLMAVGAFVGGGFTYLGYSFLRSPLVECIVSPTDKMVAFKRPDTSSGPSRYFFKDIRAVQVIPHREHRYVSYQVNLVLEDGSRAHVLPAPAAQTAQQSAADLSECIQVPVWDASDLPTRA